MLATAQMVALLYGLALPTPQAVAEDLEFFEKKVRPILAERCTSCHGPKRARSGLRLDHIDAILAGGESGRSIVVKGKPEESRLIEAIHYRDVHLQMPPKGKLSAAEIETLEDWIRRGAPWPDEPMAETGHDALDEDAFDVEERRDSHWAWSPVTRPELPDVQDKEWPRDDFDRFVLDRLEREGLSPAEEAPKRTWLRRAFFDIVGLPPSPQDVEAFLRDSSKNAFEKVVDRLLESPHYGERWGRHWLDLVRYAESYGHEFDYPIHHAYKFRDYVIRAFNADVPYDQFIEEQIAGDLIPNPRLHPEEGFNESIIGTGFWHLYQATHAPVDVRADQAERVDNQIDVMTKTFMGLTVACARCHSHKFDAITTEDYYALAGFLRSSRRQHAFLDPGREIQRRAEALDELLGQGKKSVDSAIGTAMENGRRDVAHYLLAARQVIEESGRQWEGESLRVAALSGGRLRNQDLKDRKEGKWSGESHLWWTEGKLGDRLVFELPIQARGDFQLELALTKARDYAIIALDINGQRVGEPIDLFAPKVSSEQTAFKIGTLDAGSHLLGIEIVGMNEKAKPGQMVGIDTVAVSLAPESSATLIRQVAGSSRLESSLLEEWVNAIDATRDIDPSHPMYAWQTVAMRDGASKEVLETVSSSLGAAPTKTSKGELFEDFEGTSFEGWFITGDAFGKGPIQPGSWRVSDREGGIEWLDSGVAHSGRLATNLRGALRSQTFTLESKRIHYKARGRDCRIRLIIDGYHMDEFNALIFDGITFSVDNEDEAKWYHQSINVERFLGHRAHIEILDEGNGWIEVDEIRFSDEGIGSEGPAGPTRHLVQAVLASSPQNDRSVVASLALEYQRLFETEETPGARQFRNWLASMALLDLGPAVDELTATLKDRARQIPNPMVVLASADGTGENEYVFIRGHHQNRGETVPRRFLEALDGQEPPEIQHGSGRRELVQRLVADNNPFTSRVMVNRVWHHLMGKGIVASTDNFGVLGQEPTHPELLDLLSDWFRTEAQWSTKKLIRRIVLSSTYRMSSHPDNAVAEEKDPNNKLLHRARVRRLQGEAIRDSLLAVSGRLDPTLFGKPVDVHLTPFMQGRGRPGGSGPLDGNGRRSIYIKVKRNFLVPMMLAFDTPIPFTSVGKRNVSNVPAQALTMMNDPFVRQQAEVWSRKELAREASSVAERVGRLYVEAFSRPPTTTELGFALAFLDEDDSEAGWTDLCHVLFNVKEFVFID